MKRIIYVILIAVLFFGCTFTAKYIPVTSPYYKIQGDEIIYESNELKLIIRARLYRPDEYKQYTRLDLTLQAKEVNLNLALDSVAFIPSQEASKSIIDSLSTLPDSKNLENSLIKEGKTRQFLYFVSADSSLERPEAHIKEIAFDFNNSISNGKTKLKFPLFRFECN